VVREVGPSVAKLKVRPRIQSDRVSWSHCTHPFLVWQAGDRVYLTNSVTGTYATSTIAKGRQVGGQRDAPSAVHSSVRRCAAQAHLLPARVGFPEGAAVGVPAHTAYRAVFQKARAQPGEKVRD
jgi:NADPH:quinone reductase-like Zn-dependent oxidoreductase